METGVVTIQEPVSTKINIEEAPAGVIIDHSSMKSDTVKLSTVLDDEITSRDFGNNTITGEAEVVNGSGNKETEESECEKAEAMKTISVEEDCKIVKEKASESEKDEQGSIFVHEPESFNKNIEDAKIIKSDVILEKKKDDHIIEKPEEVHVEKPVIEEDQTETKHSPEQVEEIGNISKVLIDTTPVKAREEIPIKTDETKEEEDSTTVETSVNGTEAEHKATVLVEEISRNGENIVNETVPEEETTIDGVETTKRVLLEVKKEEEEEEAEMKTDAEPLIKTVVEEANIVSSEETTAHESETLKENVEPVKNSDDAEQISSEVTVDKEKEEVITQNTEEVQESVRVIETPTIEGEEIESKASLDHEEEKDKISKDTEEHEQVLVRDIPQDETLVTEAESVDTSTVQEGEILKTNINETETHSAVGEEEGQETKENTKLNQDLKENKEQEETEMVKTISSDEVKSSDVQVEEFGEHTKPRSLEIIDESHGKEESVEVKSKETVQDEITEEKKHENLQDVASTESEKYQDNEPPNSEKFEGIPSDLALNVDKEELKDQVDGTQIMEKQRGLDSNGAEAEHIDQNRTDETEETLVSKLVTLPDVESVELGEKYQEERSVIDLTPLKEESSKPTEQEKETKLEKHETTNEEVKSEVSNAVQAKTIENIKENEKEKAADKILKSLETVESHSSLPSSSEEQQHEAVSELIEDEKVKEEEPMVQIKSEEDTTKTQEKQEESSKTGETSVVQAVQTRDIEPFLTEKEEEAEIKTDAEPRLDETEKEEIETVKTVEEDAKIVNSEETTTHESQSLKGDDNHDENAELVEAIKNSETEEDITLKTEKVQESSKAIEKPTIQEEDIESKASLELKEEVDQSSKDIEDHEHVLGRDIPQCETLEVEAVEAKEHTKPNLDKEDREQEVTETAKTVIFSHEVRPSDQVDVLAEGFGEHTEPCSSQIKDESHEREESVEVKTKETVQEESTEEKHENLLDVPSTESEKYQDDEPETSIVTNTEILEKFEEEKLKDEKIIVDPVDGTQIMEGQRGLDTNDAEAEHIEQNIANETEESHVAKLVTLPDVESVEQMQKPTLESLSEVSEETTKTIDEKIEEKSEEETVSVQESKELGEQAYEEKTLIDLTPLQEESSQPNEQEKETMLEKHEPKNEEVSSETFKGENAKSAEATENSDDAEKISSEMIGDREKEEDITQKREEVQESPRVIETPRANIEEIDQSSKDTEDHEHVLGREIPECDQTLEAEAVDTSTVQEAAILKTLETDINETEAVHSAMDGAEESQDTKDDIEVKDESQGREESVEVKSKETVQDEISEEKDVNEPETTLVSKIESQEKSEEIPLDLALKHELKDEKTEAEQVDESQTMNEPEAEQIDQNRTDETEESPDEKLVAVEGFGLDESTHNQTLLDVESVEKVQKRSLETPEILEETSKTVDEKIEDKPKEEVTLHQESQEEGSYALETKEEKVSVPEEEQENETNLQEKNEPTKEEVSNDQQNPAEGKSNEVSSARPLEEWEGETVVVAEKIEDKEVDEEEQVAEKIQKSLETVETVEPHGTVCENTDDEKVKDAEPKGDMSERGLEIAQTTDLSLPSVDQKEDIKSFDEENQIPSVQLPLDKQEKFTSTEKEETKEAKKEDEEITVSSTSKTSENVCIQQEKIEELEAPKLVESKEDKSLDIAETIKAIEATSDQTFPIEASDADKTHSSELVSEEKDQTPKQVEEIHEEETKEANKLQSEDILPTQVTPKESSDEALVSILASKENDQVTLQEDKCADDIKETKEIQQERSVSVETEEVVGEIKPKEPEDDHVETPASPIVLEKNANETLISEAKKGDEDINDTETTVALDTSATSENVCIKQEEEFANHEAPKVEESKEEKSQDIRETAEAIETTSDQTPSSDLASELDGQTPKQVEEVREKETKDEQVAVDQILPVESSQADQTPSLVKQILEEETKETVPKESFSEAPVSMLASVEDEPVTPQEDDYAGDDTQKEGHVSAETEEKVGETKPKEPEAEETKKSDDQVETSTKLTDVEEEDTQKTENEVAELTDYSTVEAEHEDENSSNLPVVEILKGLHTSLETERELNDSASSGENMIKEPADQEQKKGDAEVESNKKDSASDIIEELNLQDEHKEEVKLQDDISKEFEVNVEEKLQEETKEIAERKEEIPADQSLTEEVLPVVKILTPSSPLPSEEVEHVISAENQEEREPQQDVNASVSEKISLQEEDPRDFETSKMEQKKEETHETVKGEDHIVDNKEEKKSEGEQDEKLWDSSATKDIEEIFSSEVKEDKEVHSILASEEEINEVVISEKKITDPVGVITKAREAEYEPNEEHIETQEAPKDQEKVSADKSLTKEAFDEQTQVTSSVLLHDQVEETSFEAKKAEEDKNKETDDALIINETVQVEDQPKDFEASAEDKQTSEQEQKSNDLKEDNGTNVKLEVHDGYDSVVAPKEETGLVEEKREVENVKTELEDAIKHGVSVEEKNNKIGHEATKEICQKESKQTDTLTAIKEEIREDKELSGGSKDMPAEKKLEETMFLQKETNPECPKSMKNTDDAIENSRPVNREIESLSSVSNTQDKPEHKDEVPNQQTREIAHEVPKIAEELQQKEEESENKKDLFSEVKESEPTEKEPARKSLSDLIQNVKGTNKTEGTTTEPHIEEELKTEEEENEDVDHEHDKDDKTSPDSLVMVEAKDTVSIIKTHKKSHGILSGVGSKVKHSISKVKKVLTGKSSHTTKPSSPK